MEGKRGGEKHQCVVASCTPPTRGPACNPGMCPDWESNQRTFGLQASSHSTEPHQPGRKYIKIYNFSKSEHFKKENIINNNQDKINEQFQTV